MIQIIGTKKCKDTAKALRACKERNIPFQFVDLAERSLSNGEWSSLFAGRDAHSLIDQEGSFFQKEGYSWRDFDPQTELMEHPQLLKTPVLRTKGKVHVGFDLAVLLDWGKI